MQEVEEAITEKLKLKTELEETKQQLKLNEFKIKNIKNINDSNKGGNLEMEKMLEEKNEEIRKLKEKMSELEKNNNELKNLGLQGENKNVIEKMEEKLKSTKSFYEDEIKKIKADSKKDKDNFTLIIKV